MHRMLFIVSAVLLLSCKNDRSVVNGKIEITPGISTLYGIDSKTSTCEWKLDSLGIKSNFNVPLSSGRISILEGLPATADFVMDLVALQINSSRPEKALSASQLLKDSAFFDCAHFPVGRGIMTKFEKMENQVNMGYKLSIDLKIKEIIKTVQCVADVQTNENQVKITTEPIPINLVEWGIAKDTKASMRLYLVYLREYPEQK